MFKTVKKYLIISLGTLALVLGVIGIFLPIMPTTPFLLLAAFCYVRSSHDLYQWLINRKVIGAYIYHYITYRAIPQKTKIFSLIFLWGTLCASMLLINIWYVRLILFGVGIGVSLHLLSLKTLKKSNLRDFDVGTPSVHKSKPS
jgi:uncharacterized membrane protein YbaN (DUF454 family)